MPALVRVQRPPPDVSPEPAGTVPDEGAGRRHGVCASRSPLPDPPRQPPGAAPGRPTELALYLKVVRARTLAAGSHGLVGARQALGVIQELAHSIDLVAEPIDAEPIRTQA